MGYIILCQTRQQYFKTILISKKYKLTFELRPSEQSDAWDKVTNTYKLKDNLKIKNDSVTANDVKDWCKKNIEIQSSDSIIKKASKWCVVYSIFKDKLSEEKQELETEVNGIAPEWWYWEWK